MRVFTVNEWPHRVGVNPRVTDIDAMELWLATQVGPCGQHWNVAYALDSINIYFRKESHVVPFALRWSS